MMNSFLSNTAIIGGGLCVADTYQATVVGNMISNNFATQDAGGVLVSSSGATFTNNTITANTAAGGHGGGIYAVDSFPTVDVNSNIVSENTAVSGGGVYLSSGRGSLNNNTITKNHATANQSWQGGGGGAALYGGAFTVRGNVVISNTAIWGGGFHLSSVWPVTLSNTLVADNHASLGSGIYIYNADVYLLYTTVARNREGSAIYYDPLIPDGTLTLTNTIVASNSIGIELQWGRLGQVVALESTLWGTGAWANLVDYIDHSGFMLTSTHDYWGDPDFVNPAVGDYHIGPASAAIDRGVDTSVKDDLDGDLRPQNLKPDLGADERRGTYLLPIGTADSPGLNAGQIVTYRLAITNIGVSTATHVILTDGLPQRQQALTVGISDGACELSPAWGGMVNCDLGTMIAGDTRHVTLTAQMSTSLPSSLSELMQNSIWVSATEAVNSTWVTTTFHACHVRIGDEAVDYTTLQGAIDAANTGDTIKVSGLCGGVNTCGGLRQQVYLSKTLILRGGYDLTFAEPPDPALYPTTLDALQQGRVMYITGSISPTIENFNIVNGNAIGLDDGMGGDVKVVTAAVTIRNNLIFSGTATHGGGIALHASPGVVSGNTISANVGGVYLDSSAAKIDGNTVRANTVDGLYLYVSPATINRNTLTGNGGPAINVLLSPATLDGNYVSGNHNGITLADSAATIRNNVVMSNDIGLSLSSSPARVQGNRIVANEIGVMLDSSTAVLDNNTVSKNESGMGLYYSSATLTRNTITYNNGSWGSGLSSYASDVTLINTLIANNANTDPEITTGGGVYMVNTSARFSNCTVANNQGYPGKGVVIIASGDGDYQVTLTNTIVASESIGIIAGSGPIAVYLDNTLWYGNLQDWGDWGDAGAVITGTHNYWGDPLFVNPAEGDYHIGPGSAAIDRGVPTSVVTDIDNQPRFGIPDLGADEYWAPGALKQLYLPIVHKN
jgi:uncharacterized repeat protein (TIGR01451 family)